MTYIFTAEQLAGVIQHALKTEDPLVLENVAFLAELFYQDGKEDIKELSDQPWPERLTNAHFEAYNYGANEKTIHKNIDNLPHDFKLTTITLGQIMLIQQVLTSILEQCDNCTVFQIVENVTDRNDWRNAYNSDSKEIIIDIK